MSLAIPIAVSQTNQPSSPPEAPPSGPAANSPAPHLSPGDTVRAANELLDRIDAHPGEDPQPAFLEELNRLVADLQTTDPANPWLSCFYGRAYAFRGRNSDAIDQLRRFVETREGRNEWKAFRLLGDLFVGEFPRLAKANYARASELNPNEPSALMGLSVCAAKTGDRDEALRLARQAVDADGRRSVRFISHLARTLASAKQRDDAEREALSALRLAEKDLGIRPGVRGPIRSLADQYDLLIDIVGGRIGETGKVNADDYVRLADYMARRAEVAEQLARHDRLALLQRGVDAAGPNPSPRLVQRYAAALADVGRSGDAIAQLEKLLALEPGDAPATDLLAKLRAALPDAPAPPP